MQNSTAEMTRNEEIFFNLHYRDEGTHLRNTRESLTRRLSPRALPKTRRTCETPSYITVWINHTPPYALWCNFLCTLTRADSWNAWNRNKITVKEEEKENAVVRRLFARLHLQTAPSCCFLCNGCVFGCEKRKNDPQIGATLAFCRS